MVTKAGPILAIDGYGIFGRLARRACDALRSLVRARENRRLERLYDVHACQPVVPVLGLDAQFEALRTTVGSYCDMAENAAKLQERAAQKLDATEYAFSSLLVELRDVMRQSPTDWAPANMRPALPSSNKLNDQAGTAKAA